MQSTSKPEAPKSGSFTIGLACSILHFDGEGKKEIKLALWVQCLTYVFDRFPELQAIKLKPMVYRKPETSNIR